MTIVETKRLEERRRRKKERNIQQYKANGPPHPESTQSTRSGASARVNVVWKIAPPIQVPMTNMKTILACQPKY